MNAHKQKLLVATSTFPRFIKDTVPARFVHQLSEQFCDQYDVHILAPHAPNASQRENFGKIKVTRFPYFYPTSKEVLCDGRGILPNMRSSILGKIQIPTLLSAELYYMRKIIHHFQPDIIHSHWAIPQGLCASLAKPAVIPQVLTIHSSDLHTLRRLPFGAKTLQYIAKQCHTIFLVSSYLHEMFLQLVPNPSCKLIVLPMGVDPVFFKHKAIALAPHKKLLYIGKMIEVKGIKYLIDAMQQTKKIKLLLIGDGEDRPQLEAQARRIDPTGEIISFTGQIDHAELPKYLAKVDALIVPSIITSKQETEGMPTVILEALASGTPVLASKVGGLADTITHGQNGLLFNHSDPDDIARTINTFYQKKFWEIMPNPAQNSAQQYAWPEIGRCYSETFQQAC